MSAENGHTESIMGDDINIPSKITAIVNQIIYSPMNLALVLVIAFLIYKIIKDRFEVPRAGSEKPAEPELPRLRRDFTVAELRKFDGTQPDGRVLVAVNGNVYDVTKGKRFYGPGGPYATFAGRDASRNLATFSVSAEDKDDYDDLSDLSAMEMDSVLEWEMQFKEKYILVGKLLRKGEQPTNYDDEEDDATTENKNNETITDIDGKVTDAVKNVADGIRKRTGSNEIGIGESK